MKGKNKGRNLIMFFYCAVVAFGMLWICSASSPAYVINPWVDSNAFFTMGKAMANGATIYKDLFEQKGPLLYAVHAIAYKISNTSFTGVYIFESLSFTACLFALHKITELLSDWKCSFFILPAFSALILNSTSFYFGDSAEEFILPLLAVSLYYMLKMFSDNDVRPYVFIINGILAGCVLMIKYSVIGFWFGWMATAAFFLLSRKQVKKAFGYSFIFLGGMAVPVIPWIAYFAEKKALHDFIDSYFIVNTLSYTEESPTIVHRIISAVYVFATRAQMYSNYYKLIFVLSGIGCLLLTIILIVKRNKNIFAIFSPVIIYLCGAVFAYIGLKAYAYYFLIFELFSYFTILAVVMLVRSITKKYPKLQNAILTVTAAAALTAAPFTALRFNTSACYAPKDEESCPQYIFEEYMQKKSPKAARLNYGTLDLGFYLLGDHVPKFRYFEKQNIPYEAFPENMDEQNRYIKERLPYFVFSRYSEEELKEDNITELENYHIVCEARSAVPRTTGGEPEIYAYFLYELNN